MSGTFSPPPWVSDPDMHHRTCVTHVPWCMTGSLISGFLWSRWRGKCSRHSRRMRNAQFYVSGKRSIERLRCKKTKLPVTSIPTGIFPDLSTINVCKSVNPYQRESHISLCGCQGPSDFNTLRPRQNGRQFPDDIFNASSWMKIYKFRLKIHWSLFPKVQLTIC